MCFRQKDVRIFLVIGPLLFALAAKGKPSGPFRTHYEIASRVSLEKPTSVTLTAAITDQGCDEVRFSLRPLTKIKINKRNPKNLRWRQVKQDETIKATVILTPLKLPAELAWDIKRKIKGMEESTTILIRLE